MAFLPTLLGRKDAPTRRASAGPRYLSPGQPLTPPFNRLTADKTVSDAWERIVWVYRAIDSRARNLSTLPIVITRGRDTDTGRPAPRIPEHPLTQLLNGKTSSHENAADFRYRLTTLLDLSVDVGVPVEVLTNRAGDPVSLHILNPLWTRPIPDPDTFLAGWEMRLPDGTRYGPEDGLTPYQPGKGGVLWFKRAHPIDPYASHSWLTAAGIDIDLAWYAKVFGRNFLLNDGRPGGVIVLKNPGGVEPEQIELIKSRLRPGPQRAGHVEVLEAEDAEWIDLAATPRDAQYVNLNGMTKEAILGASGVPESVFNASGRTYSNAAEEKANWWEEHLVPEAMALARTYDELTADPYDDAEVVGYAWETVPVLQHRKRERQREAVQEFVAGVRTQDETREVLELEPLDLPGSRVLWLPAGKVPVGSDADVVALLPQGQSPPEELSTGGEVEQPRVTVDVLDESRYTTAPSAGAPAPVDGGRPPAAITPGNQREDRSIGEPAGGTRKGHAQSQTVVRYTPPTQWKTTDPFTGVPTAYLARVRAEAWQLATTHETRLAEAILRVYRSQEGVVVARLTGPKARKHTRHWETTGPARELKALDAGYILDRARWARDVAAAVIPLIMDALTAASTAAWRQLALTVPAPPLTPEAQADLAEQATRVIVDGFDNRAGKLQDVIRTADQAGASIEEITQAVQEAYLDSETWADTQSRTVVGAMNGARHVTAIRAGAVERRWVAADDQRVRPTHAAAEGQIRGIGEPFQVGDALLMFPGDPSGPIDAVINCRCVSIHRLPPQGDDTLDADLADLDAYEGEWKSTGGHVPPQGVRDAARRGLELRAQQPPSNRGGTAVGVARARDLARGATLSTQTLRRMHSFFSRHEGDKAASGWKPGEDGYPSKGLQAWLLWGGDPGRTWAKKILDQGDS